jgi:hypothetical protein
LPALLFGFRALVDSRASLLYPGRLFLMLASLFRQRRLGFFDRRLTPGAQLCGGCFFSLAPLFPLALLLWCRRLWWRRRRREYC